MDGTMLRTDAVYEEFYPKILHYMRYSTGNSPDAEDLTSEVFLKVATKLDTYDGTKAALSTWIYTIARNVLIDYYRKKPEAQLSFDDGIEIEMPREDENLDDMLEELYKALNRLTEVQRDVVILHYFKRMPHREIAEKMGLSYVNTQKICSLAVKRLRELLKQ